MFISFGMFIGLIFLTILMIIAIIFLTFTGPKDKKKHHHTDHVGQAHEPIQRDQHSHLESRKTLQESQKADFNPSQQQDSVPATPEEDPFKILPYPKEEDKGV